MEISRTIEEREITVEEFTSQKNVKEFSEYRQVGKSSNFLMCFGGSPRVFVQSAMENTWTTERALAFIRDRKLQAEHENAKERYKRDTPRMIALLTVATFLQKGFFATYPGLQARIRANQAFAKEHGYVRSFYGATRKLIEEMLRGEADDKEHGAQMRNLDNICANTDIQNFEACITHPALCAIEEWLSANNKKSRIFGFVHDSIDLYIAKSELIEVCNKAEEIMTKPVPEMHGVPLAVDFAIADLSCGDYYKHGKSLKSFTRTASCS